MTAVPWLERDLSELFKITNTSKPRKILMRVRDCHMVAREL